MTLTVVPVPGLPEVAPGADLASLVADGIAMAGIALADGDVVVVASKVVSKAEGRMVTEQPTPGAEAHRLAREVGFRPADVELILHETTTVLRSAPGVLVTETRQGFVCANAGVDRSNVGQEGAALLLPSDSDVWAGRLRDSLTQAFGVDVAVLISDTFGRPFRLGQVNVALGISGMRAVRDYRGQVDADGYTLHGTEIAVADEICSAAELVMNKLDRVPVAVVRGYDYPRGDGSGQDLLREPAQDLFR